MRSPRMGFSGASPSPSQHRRARTGGLLGPEKPVGDRAHRRAGHPAADPVPRVADLMRPGAWKLYAERGFGLDRNLPRRPAPGRPSLRRAAVSSRAIAVPRGAGQHRSRSGCRTPAVLIARKMFLLLDLSGVTDPEAVRLVLASALSGCFGGRQLRVFAIRGSRPHRCRAGPPGRCARAGLVAALPAPVLRAALAEPTGASAEEEEKERRIPDSAPQLRMGSAGAGPRRAPARPHDPRRSCGWSRTCWATSHWPEADSMSGCRAAGFAASRGRERS